MADEDARPFDQEADPVTHMVMDDEPTVKRECWDHDLDGWCPLCDGDPERCPRTAMPE